MCVVHFTQYGHGFNSEDIMRVRVSTRGCGLALDRPRVWLNVST